MQVTTPKNAGTLQRSLTIADRDQALDLLEAGLQEIPAYRWLLGANAAPDVFRWYGDILFTEHLLGLRGRFTSSGELIGLIAVAGPDHETQPVDDDLAARSRHHVTTLDGFIDRFVELRDKVVGVSVEDALSVVFAVVRPDHRMSGTLAALIEPVLDEAARAGVLVTASTADAHMVTVYDRKWNGRVYNQVTLTDGPTLWFLKVDPTDDGDPRRPADSE